MSTPLLWAGNDTAVVLCSLVNVGAYPIDISALRIKDKCGDVLYDGAAFTLQPGWSEARTAAVVGFGNAGRCEFVFVGSPADVRGSIQMFDGSYTTKASADAR